MLAPGRPVRVRKLGSADEWADGVVIMASPPKPIQAVALGLMGFVRTRSGGLITRMLPLTIDSNAQKVEGLDGTEFEVEILTANPGYWRDEQSGILKPVVLDYLAGKTLSAEQVPVMRAYLRQWIQGGFDGVEELRESVDSLTDTAKIRAWIARAQEYGCDPL